MDADNAETSGHAKQTAHLNVGHGAVVAGHGQADRQESCNRRLLGVQLVLAGRDGGVQRRRDLLGRQAACHGQLKSHVTSQTWQQGRLAAAGRQPQILGDVTQHSGRGIMMRRSSEPQACQR